MISKNISRTNHQIRAEHSSEHTYTWISFSAIPTVVHEPFWRDECQPRAQIKSLKMIKSEMKIHKSGEEKNCLKRKGGSEHHRVPGQRAEAKWFDLAWKRSYLYRICDGIGAIRVYDERYVVSSACERQNRHKQSLDLPDGRYANCHSVVLTLSSTLSRCVSDGRLCGRAECAKHFYIVPGWYHDASTRKAHFEWEIFAEITTIHRIIGTILTMTFFRWAVELFVAFDLIVFGFRNCHSHDELFYNRLLRR